MPVTKMGDNYSLLLGQKCLFGYKMAKIKIMAILNLKPTIKSNRCLSESLHPDFTHKYNTSPELHNQEPNISSRPFKKNN